MKPLSFRARLALAMSALMLVITVAISIYLPRKLEDEALALVGHKAETLAELTAFTIHPSLYFQDRAALHEALSATRGDKDVAYVIVSGPDGGRLAEFHPERATSAALSRTSRGSGISRDGSLYEVVLPIREGEGVLARLYVGVSLARLNGEVARARMGIVLLSAAMLAAAVLAAFVISNLLTRPLRDVAEGARRIAAGDLGQRVPEDRGDEIGRLAATFNDMAERVAERDAALRLLSRRMLSAQEEERVRIAREVHDELGQALTAMKIDLQQLGRRDPALGEPLAALSRTIDETVDLVRRIASDLRPSILDDLGVSAALEQQLRRLRESTGMTTTLTVDEEPQLDRLTGVTLYRIAQEALANVIRHAQATEVEVVLSVHEATAVLEIRDNGRGMSADEMSNARSLGLLGMRERAELLGGTIAIGPARGGGTVLTARLPLGKDDSNLASPVR